MTKRRLLILGGLGAMLSACLPMPREPRARHDFADFVGAPETVLPAAAVTVEMESHWQHAGVAYRLLDKEPSRLLQYAGERWAAPPSALIERYLARRLMMTNKCHLHLVVDEFAQHFFSPQESRWVIRAEGRVLPLRGKTLLARRAFTVEVPASPHPAGGIAAAREGMARLTRELAAWLAQESAACASETRQPVSSDCRCRDN